MGTEPSFLLSEKEVTKKARREGENEPFRTGLESEISVLP